MNYNITRLGRLGLMVSGLGSGVGPCINFARGELQGRYLSQGAFFSASWKLSKAYVGLSEETLPLRPRP